MTAIDILETIGDTHIEAAEESARIKASATVLGFNYDTGGRYLSIEGFPPTE